MLDNKGIKYTFDVKTTINKKIDNSFIYDKIINANDININTYHDILKKQQKRQATQDEKIELKKYLYKICLGVDIIDEPILKQYYDKNDNIKKYTYLIDIKNINIDMNNFKDEYKKVLLLTSCINELGYDNIFNNLEIHQDTFNENIKNVLENSSLFNNSNEIKQPFSMSKNKTDLLSTKAILGYLNSLLSNYLIKISTIQKTENNKKVNYYKIIHMNDIQEIIKYKKDRGFKIIDTNNIFRYNETLFNYQHLIKTQDQEQKNIIGDVIIKQDININNCLDKNINFEIEFNDF